MNGFILPLDEENGDICVGEVAQDFTELSGRLGDIIHCNA